MMDDDPAHKDRDARDQNAQDDLDRSAILARRRMFIASALAGMSLNAASCDTQVSGETLAGTSSGSHVAPYTDAGSASIETVVAQPCLMVAATPDDAATDTDSAVRSLSEFDASSSSEHIHVMPCLMVAAMDSGVHADSSVRRPPSRNTTAAMPCLSLADRPRHDAGVARNDTLTRDAAVPTPRPCLEVAVPHPCLRLVQKNALADDVADE